MKHFHAVIECNIFKSLRSYAEWEHQWVFVDVDGSLTGQEPNSKVLVQSEIYDPNLCTLDEGFSTRAPSVVCKPEARFARFAFNQFSPQDALWDQDLEVTTASGSTIVPFHRKGTTHPKGWFMVLPSGQEVNRLRYPNVSTITDISYSAAVQDLEVMSKDCSNCLLCFIAYYWYVMAWCECLLFLAW